MVSWTDAQAAVIGAALIDPDCVPVILSDMRAEDFSDPYRQFYAAFAALSADGSAIDPVTTLSRIGPAYEELTRELIRATPTAANVSEYIRLCREQARLKLLRDCGARLGAAATLQEAREAMSDAAAVSLETGQRTGWTADECVSEWMTSLDKGEKPDYISVGINALDNTLRTVPGHYVVIAGYTSNGKSAMAMQMAWAVSKTRRVGFFSFEVSRAEWTEKLLSYVSKVSLKRIQDRDLSPEEVQTCARASAEIYQRPLTFEHASGMTLEDIRARCLREKYQVIFVDYLQKIQSPAARFGLTQAVTEISNGLQTLAQRHGIAVFAMSQLSRPQKSPDEYQPIPKLSDLRESGQIEQDADAVMFVHAPFFRSYPEFRVLDVAKVRAGKLGSFYADFHGDTQTFSPPTPEHAGTYERLMRAKKIDGGGKYGGGRKIRKLEDADPADNPFMQSSLPL